ncbi:hypothetical protein HDF19_12930 [Mucilaginibacter sp. E4BP6]|uniref:hypothetical protein n=1 Tax=Mucilaginibacter sp. E4BP6 TaxID=2723089 RepID=UPI0015C70DF4|nr:hypothetical protein [Mucilaginibacter sp. E4BP6]NYE64925.1 hypothetical protein [Mucilaginibacter sp. E4BP6]
MLNNKKNLFQRVRIAMVAIVTIMSVGGAFAMKVPHHKASVSWGVVSTDANFYHVTAASTGDCLQGAKACIVTSTVMPDSQGRIPKSEATVQQNGTFTPNN